MIAVIEQRHGKTYFCICEISCAVLGSIYAHNRTKPIYRASSYLSDFNEILSNVCTPFFKSCKANNSYQYEEKRENPCFNEECEEKRYVLLQRLNIFRTNNNAESRMAMTRAGSDYKQTIRNARYEFDRQKTIRFEQAKFVNALNYT